MPIELTEENQGKLLAIRVSGTLGKADYAEFVPTFEDALHQRGKLRVLFDMVDFHGWDVSAAWQDTKFGVKHFADIERLAMVGETRWQHGMALFCKPFTKASVRYFDRADAAKARDWLGEAPPPP